MVRRIILLLSILSLSACLPGNGDEDVVSIPSLYFECESGQANDCSGAAAGKTAYVGLVNDVSITCLTYMNNINAAGFAIYFDFSGSTTTTQSGSYIVGTVDQWVNSQGVPVVTAEDHNYRACAFIDTNNNGSLDDGEPIGEDVVKLTTDPVGIISAWENF